MSNHDLVSFSMVYNMMVRYFLIVCKVKHETTLLINYKKYFSSYCLFCHFSIMLKIATGNLLEVTMC